VWVCARERGSSLGSRHRAALSASQVELDRAQQRLFALRRRCGAGVELDDLVGSLVLRHQHLGQVDSHRLHLPHRGKQLGGVRLLLRQPLLRRARLPLDLRLHGAGRVIAAGGEERRGGPAEWRGERVRGASS